MDTISHRKLICFLSRPLYRLFSVEFTNFLPSKEVLFTKNNCVFESDFGIRFVHELQDVGVWANFEEHQARFRRRFDRLRETLHSDQRVLLVRRGGISRKQAEELKSLIDEKYHCEWHVAVVDKHLVEHWHLPRFSQYYIPEADDWRSIDSEWDHW